MTVIRFDCDRCKKPIEGIYSVYGTGGFYAVGEGKAWEKFGKDGENFVCDSCVHSMPEYQAIYGARP